jgi:hypothetical protein
MPTFSQSVNSSQPQGTISGTVLDEHGQPFKGVQVCTWMRGAPAGSRESRGDCPAATTDEAGQFRIDHVAMGTIGVEAIKPGDGYVAFAGTSVSEQVTLTPNQSSATVVLKLGPKAGFLLATVKDKSTGKVIPTAGVYWVLFDANQPQRQSSGGGTLIIGSSTRGVALPPEKYLVVTVSAPGYKGWLYSDPSDPSRPAFLRLQSGEQRELAVELEPQATEAPATH